MTVSELIGLLEAVKDKERVAVVLPVGDALRRGSNVLGVDRVVEGFNDKLLLCSELLFEKGRVDDRLKLKRKFRYRKKREKPAHFRHLKKGKLR